jgi:hypothetical protein
MCRTPMTFAAVLAGLLVAGSASAQVLTATPGYGYAYAPAYVVPAYPAAPVYVAPPPSFAYVAPAPAYVTPAPAYTYAAPVPPAPIVGTGYAYVAPAPAPAYVVPPAVGPAPPATAYDETEYVDAGYAYAPAATVTTGYASTALRACWRDNFGVRHCRWR